MQVKFFRYLVFIGIIATMLMLENCTTIVEPDDPNIAPTCSISTPFNNAVIALGTVVPISVTVSDTDGTVTKVTISIDDAVVATLSSSPFTFDWNTAGVAPGQHNIKAVATDNGGLTASFLIAVMVVETVDAELASVTTAEITDITESSATAGGNVTDDGGAFVNRGVVWAETSGPTLGSNLGNSYEGSGEGSFTTALSDLSANTTYYVRAFATNSEGTSFGAEKSFKTLVGSLAIVVTGDVTDIAPESAICSGEVTDNGGEAITARGLIWGLTDPTIDNNDGFTVEGSGIGAFTSTMTSLTSLTGYYVRAYATNSSGTVYGFAKYFITLPGPPTVTTADVTYIGAHAALGGAEITNLGGVDWGTGGLVWSTSHNPDINNNEGSYNYWSYSTTNSGSLVPELPITSLNPETTYYVRAYATNDDGYNYAYGEEKSFTTMAFTVQTGSFTDTRDNTVYNTVTINNQTWMAENLAYLPEVCAPDAVCGYWVYDYEGTDVSTAKATSNYTTYGVLYNWQTAKTSCPTGWHLPIHEEWALLEMNLGMNYNDAMYQDYQVRGTDEGGKIKETGISHWADPNTGATNISAFTALPAGYRSNSQGDYFEIGTKTYFWSADEFWPGGVAVRHLYNTSEHIYLNRKAPYSEGYSVRCVLDD